MKASELTVVLSDSYPQLQFMSAETYYWSPENHTVYYKKNDASAHGSWSLLHEVAHGLLGHTKYYSDFELVRMEMEAWEKAKKLAGELQESLGAQSLEPGEARDKPELRSQNSELTTNEDHIQDCLDSDRDWLHKRSLCPDCNLSSIQTDAHTYTCVFCDKKWHVTAERFCRPYRRSAPIPQPRNES